MPEYAIPDKDTIKSEIMPYLSTAKRRFTSEILSIKAAIKVAKEPVNRKPRISTQTDNLIYPDLYPVGYSV